MRLLVFNAGSSSVKLSILDEDVLVAAEQLAVSGVGLDEPAIEAYLDAHGDVDAVGHRVVHGGTLFTGPVLVDDRVRLALETLVDLAPLHQPKSLAGLDLLRRALPGVPNVACFDTAFHAGMPLAASTYALPAEWRRRWPLRRFGFHGLSHSWAAKRTAELAGAPISSLRTVTCHLGAGASLAAVHEGRSVDTTMGFTPLDGLVMATRSGAIDPGLVLWLEQHVHLPAAELASTLEHRSGLLGLAGTADMQTILEAESRGDGDSLLAIAVYLHRLRAGIAGMAAAMGGLDAVTFTGGVGERSASIRWRACLGLAFLDVSIDDEVNNGARPDCELTGRGARARTFVVESREDLQIADEVHALLGAERRR
jgi:acetate kinase